MLVHGLAGCATGVRPPPPAAVGSVHNTKQLAAEQRRFAALFRGTPVVFATQPDGGLRVEVPLRYCFDGGRAVVKPPLGAVLERLARSQRHENTRLVVSAPADTGSAILTLATERAVRARDHMVERGIAATRFAISALAGGGAVKIVIADPALLP